MPAWPSPACPAARTAPLSSAQPRGPLPVTPFLFCTLAPTQENCGLKLPPSSHPAVLADPDAGCPGGGGLGAAWGEAKGVCLELLPEPAHPRAPVLHPSAGLSLTPACLLSCSHLASPDSGRRASVEWVLCDQWHLVKALGRGWLVPSLFPLWKPLGQPPLCPWDPFPLLSLIQGLWLEPPHPSWGGVLCWSALG